MDERDFKFLIYNSADEDIMGELFGCSSDNISLHLKKIFADGELDKISVTEKIVAIATDGKMLRMVGF